MDTTSDEIRKLIRTAAYKVAASYPEDQAEWVAQNIMARAVWIDNMAELSADDIATIEVGIKSMQARHGAE